MRRNNTHFWRHKRVIVTGGSGFLGSYVVEKLRERGTAEIMVPRSADYDLRNVDAIRQLLSDTSRLGRNGRYLPVDMVIHLAARVGDIGENQEKPAEFFYDNLMMGTQLLHESWLTGVKKFVAIGTASAYPEFAPIPFKETDFWNGYPEETNAPYGLAKKMLLVQAQTYRQQYDYNAIFLLPVNLFGPGDNFDVQASPVIPALIRKCVDAQEQGQDTLVAWGDGSPTREFLYVADAAEGIVMAAECYDGAEPINLGTRFEISIKDLLAIIAQMTGFKGEVVWDTSKPNGQPRRKLDTSRARDLFGFIAMTPLEQGLRQTIDWYKARQKDAAQSTTHLSQPLWPKSQPSDTVYHRQ